MGRTLVQKGYNFCTNQLIFREETWLITLHLTNLNHLNNHWHIVLTWDFSIWTSSGFAIITWNNPKRWEKPCITKGLATCQSLGLIFPCKKVLMVDHVVGGWTPDADQIGSNLPEVIRLCGFISPPPHGWALHISWTPGILLLTSEIARIHFRMFFSRISNPFLEDHPRTDVSG